MPRGGRRAGSGRKGKLGPEGKLPETVSHSLENGKALEKAAAILAANRETLEFLKKRGSVPKEVVFPRHPPAPVQRVSVAPPQARPAPTLPAWPLSEPALRWTLMGPAGIRNPNRLSVEARAELRLLRHRAALIAFWREHREALVQEAERLGIRKHWSKRFFAEQLASR